MAASWRSQPGQVYGAQQTRLHTGVSAPSPQLQMAAPGDDLRKSLLVPHSLPLWTSAKRKYSDIDDFNSPSKYQMAVQSADPLGMWLHEKRNVNVTAVDIDHVLEPTEPALVPDVEPATTAASTTALSGMPSDGFMSMDDFLKSVIAAREQGSSSPAHKKSKGIDATPSPIRPVAVSARSSHFTILLHEKYQALGLPLPVFTYGGSTHTWNAHLEFPGLGQEELQDLHVPGPFKSKQEAKEAVCKQAYEVVVELEQGGKISAEDKKRKKSLAGVPQEKQEKGVKGPVVNYVGQLLEFQRSTNGPQPIYTDYVVGNRFACIITMEGQDESYGSLESLHSSKKAARHDAARHAVEHFQSIGTWPSSFTSLGGIKKKKASPHTSDPSTPMPQSGSKSISPSPLSATKGSSYAHQVATLATVLALGGPEWHMTPHPSNPDFYSVECTFRNAGPHAGPHGEVRNMHGKKAAKEECARKTLPYLQELHAYRMRAGQEVLGGVGGMEEVVGVAAKKEMVGEVEVMREVARGAREDSASGDDVFEDAVEEMKGRLKMGM